jgi:hypothetical protein
MNRSDLMMGIEAGEANLLERSCRGLKIISDRTLSSEGKLEDTEKIH